MCDETQKLKWWQNSKTWKVTKLKNAISNKSQKLKSGQNSKTQIATKKYVTTQICDKTQIVIKLKLWQKSNCDKTQIVTKLK